MRSNHVEAVIDDRTQAPDDGTLLRRFRAGDATAFKDIVRAHRSAVYRVARRVLGSHEDADEAAQLAFVRAWKGLHRFRGDAALRTWLVRIALNVARTMRAARRPVEGMDAAERLPDPAEGSDAALGRDQERQRLRRAVAKLPPRQREVVILKVFSEMTCGDVAAVLRLSEGTVKAHLHKAVANLRRRLGLGPVPENDR
jgi:RNA polymerase sigma-70 factor (ECF subfamily)